MTISKDLFLATLSLDSYNRGYNSGLVDGGIGDPDGLGENSQLGSALILGRANEIDINDWEAANFYAIAYDTPYGLVISYRGTDDQSFFNLGSDVWTGWVTGGGALAVQARLAAEFYHSVKIANPGKHIILTGHSLGGGLAGMVASLFGEEAAIFDNMPFELASDRAYEIATRTDAQIDVLATETAAFITAQGGDFQQAFNAAKQNLENERQDILDTFYNGGTPQAIDRSGITGNFVTGEALQAARALGGQETVVDAIDSLGGLRSPVDLHSVAFLDVLRFAQDNGYDDWNPIGQLLWDAAFNDDVARFAGFKGEDDGGTYGWSAELIASIAYSALDGSNGLVFGNTGIRALFDDANELGRLVENDQLPGFLTDNIDDFADLIVQFAGQMALQKVDYLNLTGDDADFAPEQGILSFFKDGVAVANDNEPLTNRIAA